MPSVPDRLGDRLTDAAGYLESAAEQLRAAAVVATRYPELEVTPLDVGAHVVPTIVALVRRLARATDTPGAVYVADGGKHIRRLEVTIDDADLDTEGTSIAWTSDRSTFGPRRHVITLDEIVR